MKRTNIRKWQVLGLLGLPLIALAVTVLALSWGQSTTQKAEATFGDHGIEFSIGVPAGNCDTNPSTAAGTKCTLSSGSAFQVQVSLNSMGNVPSYEGFDALMSYSGASSKNVADANVWPDCAFEATSFPPGQVAVGCGIGIGAPPSIFTGVIATANFNCTGAKTISLDHGNGKTALTQAVGSVHGETDGTSETLDINCPTPTSTSTPTPTPLPPSEPRMFKKPKLQNDFLTNQPKIVGDHQRTCAEGNNVANLTEQLNIAIPEGTNPKGGDQVLGAMEFEVRFDPKLVCVNLIPGPEWDRAGALCIINDKDDGLRLEGIARIGCVTLKKDHNIDELQPLAFIEVRPQPELYSQIRPNQDNGIVVQILNQDCDLGDEQGHTISLFSCEDADITFRYLEGDVDGPDCAVNVFDAQNIAFRWGVRKGSLLYKSFMDLEPSGQVKGDGDIDIKDLQFVFGRLNSTCNLPHPAQDPVNPKP